jgi:hypothetical protein
MTQLPTPSAASSALLVAITVATVVPIVAADAASALADDEIPRLAMGGGSEDVAVACLPGLDHLFQIANEGGARKYAFLESSFAESALDTVSSRIVPRVGSDSTGEFP